MNESLLQPPLLELRGLAVDFATDDGTVHAVDGIDLALARGRTLGLVGESGCGKSVTSLAIMGLLAAMLPLAVVSALPLMESSCPFFTRIRRSFPVSSGLPVHESRAPKRAAATRGTTTSPR